MGANVHNDKHRRRPRNRQRGNDPPKGSESPGGSRDDYYPNHRTPLNPVAILCITFHAICYRSFVEAGVSIRVSHGARNVAAIAERGGFAVKSPPPGARLAI
jgi:hypothetical protein